MPEDSADPATGGDEEFDLPTLVTARTWRHDSPPEEGQDVSGILWMQGFLRRRIEGFPMGRIIVQTEVTNPFDGDKSIRCGMLVDTGAGALILPMAWKERFGTFQHSEPVDLQLANREVVQSPRTSAPESVRTCPASASGILYRMASILALTSRFPAAPQ